MAKAPIDILMDRVDWSCTRCGAKAGTCKCWDKIVLRCPKCKRAKRVYLDPSDPPGTAIVEATCDRCDDGGGFPETHYYDSHGRWFDGEGFRAVGQGASKP